MTTYYAKPLEALADAIYDVNPALYIGLASRMGRFPISIADPWNTDYIHFNALKKATKMRVGDELGWDATSDSIPDPGLKKGKWFWWNMELSEKQYKSIEQNPNGLIAQQIKAEMKAQQDYFVSTVDIWLNGYLYATTTDDYDAEWKPMLGLQAATGTVSTPEDINSTAGTANDYTATKCTGTALTVDAINTSFGASKLAFYQQYDSNTHQAMYTGNDTFTILMHPAVIARLERGYLSNASGELDYSQSFMQKLRNEFDVVGTFSTDAAYDGASTTEAQYTMCMNMRDNFQIVESIPYTVEPWQYNPATNKYRMRAYWKIFPMIKPFWNGSAWKKAVTHGRVLPYSNS